MWGGFCTAMTAKQGFVPPKLITSRRAGVILEKGLTGKPGRKAQRTHQQTHGTSSDNTGTLTGKTTGSANLQCLFPNTEHLTR